MIHLNRGATSLGTFSEEEVREGLRSGRFVPGDMGWREGMANWQPLSQFSEFAPSGGLPPQVGLLSISLTATRLYESMNGFFPTTEQALVTQPQNDPRPTRWYQLFKELPKDPWGSDYIYRNPGLKNPGGYDLYSAGPDRQADTADDDWGGG
jgi:hypothetical protein